MQSVASRCSKHKRTPSFLCICFFRVCPLSARASSPQPLATSLPSHPRAALPVSSPALSAAGCLNCLEILLPAQEQPQCAAEVACVISWEQWLHFLFITVVPMGTWKTLVETIPLVCEAATAGLTDRDLKLVSTLLSVPHFCCSSCVEAQNHFTGWGLLQCFVWIQRDQRGP